MLNNEIFYDENDSKIVDKIHQRVQSYVQTKFDTFNQFFEENNIETIDKKIEEEVQIYCDKYEFKEDKENLYSCVMDNKIFIDIYNGNSKFSTDKLLAKKQKLINEIIWTFPSGDYTLSQKCKYDVYNKYIFILQNIMDMCKKINENEQYIYFYCPNCDCNNVKVATNCKDCNYEINYKLILHKFKLYQDFGIDGNDFKEKYNKVQDLVQIMDKLLIFVTDNDYNAVPLPEKTNSMNYIYNKISSLKYENYYNSHKNEYPFLYSKMNIYRKYWVNKHKITQNIITINDIPDIVETETDNRYSSHDKYECEFEYWFSKINYFYCLYMLDTSMKTYQHIEYEIMADILDYTSNSYFYENITYDNLEKDFYKWYLNFTSNTTYRKRKIYY